MGSLWGRPWKMSRGSGKDRRGLHTGRPTGVPYAWGVLVLEGSLRVPASVLTTTLNHRVAQGSFLGVDITGRCSFHLPSLWCPCLNLCLGDRVGGLLSSSGVPSLPPSTWRSQMIFAPVLLDNLEFSFTPPGNKLPSPRS